MRWLSHLPYNHFRLGIESEIACWSTYPKVWNVIYGKEYSDLPGYLRRLREAAQREAATNAPVNRPAQTVDHDDTIQVIALSEDGRRLATAGKGHSIRLWNVLGDAAQEVTTSGWHQNLEYEAVALAFSPEAETVSAGGSDGLVVWDVASGEKIYEIYELERHIRAVVLADRATLTTNTTDGGIVITDLAGVRDEIVLAPPKENWPIPSMPVKLSLTGSQRFVVVSRYIGKASLYVLLTEGDEGQAIELYQLSTAKSCEFDYTGNRLACIDGTESPPVIYDTTRLSRAAPQQLRKWISTRDDIRYGPPEYLQEWCHVKTVARQIAMSGDGRRIAVGYGGKVEVWDISKQAPALLLSPNEFDRYVSAIAVDHAGAVLAVATGTQVHLFQVPPRAGGG